MFRVSPSGEISLKSPEREPDEFTKDEFVRLFPFPFLSFMIKEMNQDFTEEYDYIRNGGSGFYEQKRGLIAVWGKEAVQFLNGLITNDVAKMEENAPMFAAFPNANGRLLAVVRVLKQGDKFLFETEAATREKVYNNLFRFTFAGDFFVEDLSENYRYFEISNFKFQILNSDFVLFQTNFGADYFVPNEAAESFIGELKNQNAVEISDELYEVLRVENGVPKYGVDMDETTIVPETGIAEIISYQKGCYIGQEIIARIHFRGHIAKQLTGLIFLSEPSAAADGLSLNLQNAELKSADGKNAGKITSAVFSPRLEKTIALGYVRYDYLADGTELKVGETTAIVKQLPFIGKLG
jgi:folate-binding protein YgfZ